MDLFFCCKESSVRPTPIYSVPRNKENTSLPNPSALGVGPNNNFAEHAAVLNTIQKNGSTSASKRYFSNEQYFTAQQYNLLHYSYLVKIKALDLLDDFSSREQTNPKKLAHFDSRLTEAVDRKNQFITEYIKKQMALTKTSRYFHKAMTP